MTYSVAVRAPTRDECKQRLRNALRVQTQGQTGHAQDIPHIERLLCSLVDLLREHPHEELVVDAYGYVSVAGDGTVRSAVVNAKVYSASTGGAIPVVVPETIKLPPRGTF